MTYIERFVSRLIPQRRSVEDSSSNSTELNIKDEDIREKVLGDLRFEAQMKVEGASEIIEEISGGKIAVAAIETGSAVSIYWGQNSEGNRVVGILVDPNSYTELDEISRRMAVGKASKGLYHAIRIARSKGKQLTSVSPGLIRARCNS